ncbi:hypothetical protein [Kitasatospora viridis]|uniref:Uncharacterized protein n=1 Tax=Kitasatospora viridis TaxID=281105 RepID=A0A561UH11_9ACTN|nr:hypothetical protein [Kitasatospora viridis]TWF98646.1 hypothetical protein FHX73_112467 [Kitasatospora viridis]
MAIEQSGEAVSMPQFIDANWPGTNENGVRDLAARVRDFAGAVGGRVDGVDFSS